MSPVLYPEDYLFRENKFGRNPSVSAPEDISDLGGDVVLAPAVGAVTFASGSGDDTVLGSGAQGVRLWGLDSNKKLVRSDVIATDGAGTVTPGLEWFRVHRVRCIGYGAGLTNAGLITVNIGGVAQIGVTAGFGQSQSAIYTIPADYSEGYLKRWFGSFLRNGTAKGELAFMAREPGDGGFSIRAVLQLTDQWEADLFADNDMPAFPSLTDLKCRAIDVTATAAVYAGFDVRMKV